MGLKLLTEGLATIRFDSGAVLSLEAPATLDLIDAMNCHLHGGTAVANVPESAIGFRVETPTALVIDYGTRFAVSVEPDTGGTLTQVFDGMVKVKQPSTGNIVELRTGQRSAVSDHSMQPATEGIWERVLSDQREITEREPDWHRVLAHKDAFLGPRFDTDSNVLLYVKKGEAAFDRIAYLGFDLAGLGPDQILEAELILHLAPTGLGLASHVPDSIFHVYAVSDPEATWREDHLFRGNAPAHQAISQSSLNPDEVTLLGTFPVKQGVQHGRVAIVDPKLTDFLRTRAGSEVTLILTRETPEIEKNGLVHGFASRRHPILPGPKLAIRVRQE